MFPDLTYCINLDRRPDRWARMVKQCAAHDIRIQRFSAYDGSTLDVSLIPESLLLREYDTTAIARWAPNIVPQQKKTMSLGEVGCALSHVEVWFTFSETAAETALVLEDDVELEKGFSAAVPRVLASLPTGWDLCYLGYWTWEAPWPRAVCPGIGVPTFIFGSYAYMLTRLGAQKLLSSLPVSDQIDAFLSSRFGELNVYCADPPCVIAPLSAMDDSNIVHSAYLP